MRIFTGKGTEATSLTVHLHLVDALSTALTKLGTVFTGGVQLTPNDYCTSIQPRTWHYFIHWVYFNDFTRQGETWRIGFRELLDLYFLALQFDVTVLKNIVIDRLIDECSASLIPVEMSRQIYSHAKSEDPLRRLWVDFYIWDIEDDRFRRELESNNACPEFIKDLATAQMELLRSEAAMYSKSPPYSEDPTAYHRPDAVSGICCCRAEFEGGKYKHRRDYLKEKTNLESRLAVANSKIRELEDDLIFIPESRRPSKRRKLVHSLRDSGYVS